MHRELLLAEAMRTVWAIEPTYGERVLSVLNRWSRGEPASEDDLLDAKAIRDARAKRTAKTSGRSGAIAVIPLYGIIAPKVGLITEYSGGTSCQAFASMLREAVNDETIGTILLDIDSPGGSVAGVQEAASEVMQARTEKPVIGIANFLAASAAYWIGSCCSELYASPSAEVGSIGVYTAHEDVSEALAKQGVKTTLISAGKYKTEGSPYAPLSDDAKKFIQSHIDESYRAFTANVARGRSVSVDRVRNGFGQGRVLSSDAALNEGMIDGIKSFDALVGDLQARPRSTTGAARAFAAAPTLAEKAAWKRASDRRRRELEILDAGGWH